MKISKAHREFKKRFGQANHFLITALVGLDAVESGLVATKPATFSTSWNPKDQARSAQRSRVFALQSFLGWAVESLEMYLTELNRKPKELESETFTELYSRAGQHIYKKAIYIGDETNIDPVLIALMEVLITWRNYTFHYDIDNQIRPESLQILKDEKERIKLEYCGLDIDVLKETWENGRDFTFKETASLISATHKYVQAVDAYVLRALDIKRYVSETILGHFKVSEKSLNKYKSLPIEKKFRYLKSLIIEHVGLEPDDEFLEKVYSGLQVSHLTNKGTRRDKAAPVL